MKVKMFRRSCSVCGYSDAVSPVRLDPRENDPCPECFEGKLEWKLERQPVGMETELEAVLNSYPRLCSHLICESLGYLTPKAAANLLWHYAQGKEFWCEWISHLAGCGVRNPT